MTARRWIAAVALFAALPLLALGGEISFPRFNGTYENLTPDLMPVSTAGMTIELSSPSNSLTIDGHRIEVEPLGDGVFRFRGSVDFSGRGELIARLGGTVPAQLQDVVELPSQTFALEGEVGIVRDDTGYDLTTVSLPAEASIEMKSQLAASLVGMCELMLMLAGGDCSAVDAALGKVTFPLPEPGETYRIDGETFTAEERAAIDALLFE